MTTQNSLPVLQCVLSNGAHPEYGQATVPFPIPAGDYGRTLELLAGMGLGDPLNRDCRVDELHSGFPILKRLEKVGANLDELDYLARRLDSFTEREAAQFQGMAVRLGIFDMTDFINLTFCCQQATVITDFSDLEQIGRDHYMNLHGGCASMEELERLDARRTALDLILNDTSGQITPYGVVYDNGMELEQRYDGCHFPDYKYSNSLMDVSLTSVHDTRQTVFLSLPMPERQMERLIFRSGFESEDFAQLTIQSSEFPQPLQSILNQGRESVFELNHLCCVCSSLSRQAWNKLEAAAVIAAPEDSGQLSQLAQNLDLFDFVPDVHNPEEYGRHMIQQSGRFDYDSGLDAFYDYERYGRQCVQQEQGAFTEQGYIAYHGTLTLDELMQGDPAEQYQKEQAGRFDPGDTAGRLVGRVTYAGGEALQFTDPQEYLRTIREELPCRAVTGFRFETLTDDPAVRNAADDMIYDLYGEENPRPLEDYAPRQGPSMGGTSM